MIETRTIYIMAYRQIKRFLRAKSRLIGSIVNPVMWLVFFGLGWSSAFSSPMAKMVFHGLDYMSYLSPGVVMMTIFTASFIGGITVIWDKEFGFLKEILVAPVSRTASILGRALGDMLVALLQGTIILIATFYLAPSLKLSGIPLTILAGALVAFSFTSIGIAIASKMRSIEGFQILMSFVNLPLLFSSGAFYPLDNLPEWMKLLAYVNPLTYGVDLARWSLTGVSQITPSVDLAALILLAIVMVSIASYIFNKATIE